MKPEDIFARGCPFKNLNENYRANPDMYSKLNVFDWLEKIHEHNFNKDIVEIRFKNTRKAYYLNVNNLKLKKGDIVAVEASPGHDIGIVSLTGDLVLMQLKKYEIDIKTTEFKKIYRIAKPVDLEKWFSAIELEYPTMIKTRKIAEDLKLDMKIGDVEYQGDKTKAIFYYIADDRVDFRELIKILAEEFKIRVEMKQIGARQEAGRIGGIGPCGRELCCSSWMTNFISVTTNAARYQDISLNPQKLAGQCSKLKCCLNYELPCYLDALEDFPDLSVTLETVKGPIYSVKRDIYRRIMWFSFEPDSLENSVPLSVEKIKEYIEINKNGNKINLDETSDNLPNNTNDYKIDDKNLNNKIFKQKK
jgi:cell fate regulator YaaT (PSP1 superfamily)